MNTSEAPLPQYVRVAQYFDEQRKNNPLPTTYSYQDITISPNYSDLGTIDDVSTRTDLVEGIPLEVPIISANMKTVTEVDMSIFMARIGGIGIIHRAMSIEKQVEQVLQVKDATKFVVEDPPITTPDQDVAYVRRLMDARKRGFVLIMDPETQTLIGIATKRDVHRKVAETVQVTEIMTPKDKIVVAPPTITMDEALELMYKHRIEKLPIVDGDWHIGGVITDHDIEMIEKFPLATKDQKGRLRVGAAIGVQEETKERAQALIEAGVDVLVVDVLHGDSKAVHDITQYLAAMYPQIETTTSMLAALSPSVPVISGNICTAGASRRLAEKGSKANKVGFGDGALCTTRLHTGTGRGQFTSVVDSAAAIYGSTIRTIADGSIRKGGDLAKAIAAGGDSAMVGTALAGTDQSPGEIFIDQETGDQYKEHYGMASRRARQELKKARNGTDNKKRAPQGIETKIAYVGDAEPIVDELIDGLKHAMANVGARTIQEFQQNVIFEIQPTAVQAESNPHFTSHGRRR